MATKRQSLGKGLDALLGLAEDINANQELANAEQTLSDGGLGKFQLNFFSAESISQDENLIPTVCKS